MIDNGAGSAKGWYEIPLIEKKQSLFFGVNLESPIFDDFYNTIYQKKIRVLEDASTLRK